MNFDIGIGVHLIKYVENLNIIVIDFLKPGNYEIINVGGYLQYKIIYNTKYKIIDNLNKNIIHSSICWKRCHKSV